MNIPSFTSLFKKKKPILRVPDTMLVKKLKNLSSQSNLLVFKDVKIYHHTQSYTIPLIVLDDLRGLYIFETKEWTFDELKNATVQKAQNQEASSDTLAFENTHSIIRKKFNELTHNDGVPIFNYLLMENLNTDEYEHLSDSFKELLPREKIIFSDSLQTDIFKKLQNATPENHHLPSIDTIMGTLLIQYSILDDANTTHLCTKEQIAFIDRELQPFETLRGLHGSGKSSLLLLKSIVEIFHDKTKKIIIIKPTTLACDIIKKKLLDIVEHAIIEVDLTQIEIITPLELLNRHQEKLKRDALEFIDIDDKLMKKSFKAADLIICDDANLYDYTFIAYLKHIQAKAKLLLVNPQEEEVEQLDLSKNFRDGNRNVHFYQTNPHAKALHIIASLLDKKAKKIVVVSNSLSSEKLKDDLSSFVVEEAKTLHSSVHLIQQDFTDLMLCNYNDLNAIEVDHIILMDLCFVSINEVEYAFHLAKKSVSLLYEEDCQEIKDLRIKHEQSDQK